MPNLDDNEKIDETNNDNKTVTSLEEAEVKDAKNKSTKNEKMYLKVTINITIQ